MMACLLWRHVFIIDVYAIKMSYAFRGVYVYACSRPINNFFF